MEIPGGGGMTSTPWNGNYRGWGSKAKLPFVCGGGRGGGVYGYFLELYNSENSVSQ